MTQIIFVFDCDRKLFNMYRVIKFDPGNYDFADYIVNHALASKNRFVSNSMEYLCKVCDRNLRSSPPKMPRKAIAYNTTVLGNTFLQAIREKPEFVCTCCHRWLFRRSILSYDQSKYDMSNDIVKETLDLKYRHPMNVMTVKGRCSAHEHSVDYGDSDSESY